ncbi:O-antigen polymerase [alpha proteobacterium BAL199]|nr:O-antigen polymerase [alpha proteobacterium BAL199]
MLATAWPKRRPSRRRTITPADKTSATDRWFARPDLILAGGLFLFATIGAMAKQAMAPVSIALALGLLAVTLCNQRRSALPSLSVVLLFAVFVTYVAGVHLPPALGEADWAETIAKLGMLAIVLWLASAGWNGPIRSDRLAFIARWALAGLAIGSAFLLMELTFDSPFRRLSDGLAASVVIDPARYNRPAVGLLLLSLPLAGLLARQVGRRHALVALLLGLAPALASQSAAGWLAALIAALVYVTARWRPRAVLIAGSVLTVGLVIGAPPLLTAAYQTSVRQEIAMPLSFTDRLEIWDHASDAIRQAPWTGQGLGSVRHLPLSDEQRSRYRYHKAPATHAHNAALQIWVEFGAIGIAVGLVLLGIAANAIRQMDRNAQPVALATASALLVIAMVSFGLWQETWMGLIGVTIVVIRLAALPAPGGMAEPPAGPV